MWRDLRFGARQLLLNPGFALVAVLSLALGIGANTAIFQLVNAVRLRTLPVQRPEELAYIDFAKGSMRSGWFSTRSARFTYTQWEQLRDHSEPFSGLLAWSAARFNLTLGGEARYAEGLFVSGDFFRVLGVQPLVGRVFNADDDRLGCGSPGAVISYAFWQRELGGAVDAPGRTVMLDGRPFPVIGVTGPGFFGVEVGHRYDVALPVCADPLFDSDGKGVGRIPGKSAFWLSAMGRLKPGWTVERARTYLQTLSPGFMQATLPPTYRPEQAKRYLANKLDVTAGATGVSGLRREYESPLWLLLATTGLVLLIACANLANLLLARASVREREIAIRQAIGASRARLIGQLLAEAMLLSVAGTLLGVLLAQALSRGLVAFLSGPNNQVFVGLGLDPRVLAFTTAVAAGTCLLFGLLPALRATRISPASAMRAGGRGLSAGRERFGLRRLLVVAQVSLSLVLLVGALLFVRSLRKLLSVDAGFHAEGITVVDLDLRPAHYAKDRFPLVYRDLLDRLRATPGVVSAAQVNLTPVSGSGWDENAWADGTNGKHTDCFFNRVSPDYFRTMGTGLVGGRDFTDRDTLGAAKIAIVNEAFARIIFGGGNPVGRSFRVEGQAGKPDPVYQVVGMVRNTKYYEIREEFMPLAFFPETQDGEPGPGVTFVVRSAGPPAEIVRSAKSVVSRVHPAIGIQFSRLAEQIRESLLRDRLMAMLAGAFGILAGMLATLGLYGVIAYMVARRRNEIGVRVALGANRGRVVMLVLREATLLLAVGLVVGTGLALWAGRAAGALLFGLKPYDPTTLAFAAILLAAVALLASYIPALRASRMEPMSALRED
ncbi:MAG: ABC transporter permease [Candidatus Sulfopaludibacter sp.]|nr:ABC transporter permease [Candidatus Sulfopaludibacter sp.]